MIIEINNCPGTLSKGFNTYSRTCLKRVFNGKKVSHILAYDSPSLDSSVQEMFETKRKRISISGVQDKLSVILDGNKLRLVEENERGTHILKPIPQIGNKRDQMPANEHLTMQIARQVYKIDTAENALIFFKDGTPAYITKRFDNDVDGKKLGQEDFASLLGRTPQMDGEHFKYLGNYLELFDFMRENLSTYMIESIKMYRLIIFNYLFSNGDAHLKNFSLLETSMGDYTLSPSYDLLNSHIHIDDSDFALEGGLLPKELNHGKFRKRFQILADKAMIKDKLSEQVMLSMLNKSEPVLELIQASYLNDKTQRSYFQQYQKRLKRLLE